jgi:uncharacterized Zn-binding protein involved in type VI secretion
MSKPATRLADLDQFHCSQPSRGESSDSVFVDGRGWSRFGDKNIVHLKPAGNTCVPHQSPIVEGSETVFINGIPAGHLGSDVGGEDCTIVIQGSETVFVG